MTRTTEVVESRAKPASKAVGEQRHEVICAKDREDTMSPILSRIMFSAMRFRARHVAILRPIFAGEKTRESRWRPIDH